jgi:hypothetical protein
MNRKLMMTTAGFLLALSAQAAPVWLRQDRQQARIGQGVRSGELTRAETRNLETRERALAATVRRDRLDGGGLTLAERAKINARQNNLSQDIYRLKHNNRGR